MFNLLQRVWKVALLVALSFLAANMIRFGSISLDPVSTSAGEDQIGREVSVARHLVDGEETTLPLPELLDHGELLFSAVWTIQEGGGRPLTKGTGEALSDPEDPLLFPRNFNRVSAPDANSCAGCHNQPFGIPGGGGDIVANVFVLGQRFDFVTFDPDDEMITGGSRDERGEVSVLEEVGNSRATLGMFGSGYIEMLARQMTADLQAIRDSIEVGRTKRLRSKGVSFGWLTRRADGSWDTTAVRGLPAPSLTTTGPDNPPSLVIRPFHQAGAVVSLRQFTNNAYNHHHGMQATERFGDDVDPDGDGFTNELTRADITAATLFQAAMGVPGRVIPDDPAIQEAILLGEQQFEAIGCGSCHVSQLPLYDEGWIFTEPNPYNPPGNLQPGEAETLAMDLNSPTLPQPRLSPDEHDVVWVPAYTDLKLHDITSGRDDPNREPLDMTRAPGSDAFFDGNSYFLTRKLWGVANEPPYFHHGRYTTMREAILAHDGEARHSRQQFEALDEGTRDAVIEFLKSLQVLPPGTPYRIVDQDGNPQVWPPH